ncbi:1-phosphofructokinase family hexose kinase [Microbacterium halotolerans]|uniref:1-phosphofructokinase family hexose kinase n=1 Tax=Microbacterium halotolerans TaxID=246613 RepID=UPI000E6AD087|nr:PfkB family carbohydrate kinase [Microbacterium halotolerans]
MSGIVTVTLAPAIDLTYRADAVVPGAVNRASAWTRELSGKGVNVSHAVALSGTRTVAVLPMAEADAREAEAEWLRPVAARERTRVNVTMVTADGVTTKLNAPTSPLTHGEVEAVLAETVSRVRAIGADWIVLAGSVPPLAAEGEGAPGGGSVDLCRLIDALSAETDARIAVDTSGGALEGVFARSLARVALVKPNTHELAAATSLPLRTLGEVRSAALRLVERGCETVYVSMGEDGALAVTRDGSWWARAAPAAIINSTGAGDASLAGFLVHALAAAPGSRDAHLSSRCADIDADLSKKCASREPDEPDAPRAGIDVAAAIAGAASFGALSVSQSGTLLRDPASAPQATVIADPDGDIRLADPAG